MIREKLDDFLKSKYSKIALGAGIVVIATYIFSRHKEKRNLKRMLRARG